MENENKTTKLVVGLLIGGAIGAGVLYSIHAVRNRKVPVMEKIGKTISEFGEMVEHCDLSASNLIEKIEEKLPSGKDVADEVLEWVSSGVNLWNKLTKGS